MQAVVAERTRRVRLVIQDVHQPHNVSACLRSADAFGVQDVDIVTLRQPFKPSTVSKGVVSWLTMRRYRDVAACVQALRAQGYVIATGLPRQDARPLTELPLERPIAVVFGNEHAGVDPGWLPEVDFAFTIPMVGMVESLNISVSAAITLHHLTAEARRRLPASTYHLSEVERAQTLNAWACRSTTRFEDVIKRLRDARLEG